MELTRRKAAREALPCCGRRALPFAPGGLNPGTLRGHCGKGAFFRDSTAKPYKCRDTCWVLAEESIRFSVPAHVPYAALLV